MVNAMVKGVSSLKDLNLKEICLDSRFGDLKFEKSFHQLEKIKDVIIELEELNYEAVVAQQEMKQIILVKNRLKGFVGEIKNFNLSVSNPQQRRDQIQEQIDQFYQNEFLQVRSSLVFLRQEAKPTRETEKELQKALTKAKNLEEKLQTEFEKIQKEKGKISEGRIEIGSKLLSMDFNDQYDIHERQAEEKWYRFSKIFYVAIFFAPIVSFIIYIFLIRKSDDDFLKIEWGFFSALIIAIIYYGLNFCSRNFNIQKNLAILNRNKRNVAETFQRFLESEIADPDTKNKLLEEASRSMFENESTGYLSKDQMQISTPVQEMVTKIISNKT